MDALSLLADGLVVVFNGLYALVVSIASPVTVLVGALAASLALMARYELHELDLQGRKPSVPRH